MAPNANCPENINLPFNIIYCIFVVLKKKHLNCRAPITLKVCADVTMVTNVVVVRRDSGTKLAGLAVLAVCL